MGDEFNKPGAWEEAWQQAFDGTEQAPPDRVWKGLENSLMEQQLQRYKRKLFLYQWLAAASVMLLGIWAGWWMFIAQPQAASLAAAGQNAQTELPASNPNEGTAPPTGLSETGAAAREQDISGVGSASSTPLAEATDPRERAIAQTAATKPASRAADTRGSAENSIVPAASPAASSLTLEQPALVQAHREFPAAKGGSNSFPLSADHQGITPLADAPAEHVSIVLIDPGILPLKAELLLQSGALEREIRVVGITPRSTKKKSIIPNGDLWLGASLASNFFNPNMASSNGYGLFWAQQPPTTAKGEQKVYTANVSNWDEKERSLPSFDFKLEAAFRLNNRWMLQSSVQYGSYRVNTLTGTFTNPENQKSYPLYYTNFNNDRLQVASPGARMAAPVDAMNTYRFLSVPLSFSYIVFEKHVGLALSSGFSSEIFLGGHIDDIGSNRLERYRLSAGEDSPFRKVHFNALLGVQLFYRAGPNHLITIEPTYKRAITNFHKNGTYFDSRPSQIGIAAGFRYILR